MNVNEIVALASERIKAVPADGSVCGLCEEPIREGRAVSVGFRIPIIGMQDKHFCPEPCVGIIFLRIQEVIVDLRRG